MDPSRLPRPFDPPSPRERETSPKRRRTDDVNEVTEFVTQARTGSDLLKLSNNLHDFARHLNEQERYLHQQQAELIEQETAMSGKLLDGVLKMMETNFNLAETSPEPYKAEQMEELKFNNEQLGFNISVHQTTIEVLLSELMIEREARKTAEAKLQEKKRLRD
ncbi:uncharacterized protein M421DRAFT_9227 [Didymella exigua CBS 183.55]|uniref:Uncharacterized protein n=1 Tax=Didymella exigua CBS 183.55 TaxID=1150837 RepID=A0A6A5R9Q5_9PLEO|nr:uncharacterized protein M421DRAFT_9227 [Didymella exigua CBS 183.55]KAF1923928.1 hypothetical protein M421DRAFT_9227 [Didymella exigua CBS 183.55]